MNDRDIKTLHKIISHINRIDTYSKNIEGIEEFDSNLLVKDAVVFNLLQIGELCNNKLTDIFKSTHTTIPWQKIYGLRNWIVHDYDNVHSILVYQIITEDLIELSNDISQLLND